MMNEKAVQEVRNNMSKGNEGQLLRNIEELPPELIVLILCGIYSLCMCGVMEGRSVSVSFGAFALNIN